MRQVYNQAGITPDALDYLEAHGTGTAVGDPVEARAIGEALGVCRSSATPLPIGSIKGNLGHLEAASGVAGLVKAINCLKHRTIPATVGLERANPNIDLQGLNIDIVTEPRALKPQGPITVGVNSFGFGGANAHVILQAPVEASQPAPGKTVASMPLILSSRDSEALSGLAAAYADLVRTQPEAYQTFAYNAAFRRDRLPCSAVFWGKGDRETVTLLEKAANGATDPCIATGTALDNPGKTAFIYSGNGSQWAGMGRRLLADPLFCATIAEIDAFFQPLSGFPLADELAGKKEGNRYQYTEIAQPALFALQVGVTRMLNRDGIFPEAVAGHSVGEVAAAWAAGILDLKSAVAVIYHRSRLQGTTKGHGQMTAVGLGAEETSELLQSLGLEGCIALAGSNSYRGATVAGDPEALAKVEAELTRRELFQKRLDLDYAFHSPAMDSIEFGVYAALDALDPGNGDVAMFSTVTGKRIDGTELGAKYWWLNIRRPVLFQQAIEAMQADGVNVFIEVGPHAVLRSYLNDCIKTGQTQGRVIPTLKRDDDDPQRVRDASGQAIVAGAKVDWSTFFATPHPFCTLPNYPWQRERYWHPQTAEAHGTLDRHKLHPLLGYALRQQELSWENQLDTQLLPTLADHVVGEAVVFPGTGYAELGLAAAHAWLAGDLIEIEDLEIRSPLILESERSQLVRVRVQGKDGSTTVVGRGLGSEEPWTVHCVCRILQEPGHLPLQVACPQLPLRQPDFTGASHQGLTRMVGPGLRACLSVY